MPTAFILHPAPRAYYEWLGRFVEAFAGVEGLLFDTLQRHAGLSDDFAGALFSGTRGEAGISLMRRLWEINPPSDDDKAELDEVFSQFKAINNIRNSLIHFGSRGEALFERSSDRMSSNRPRVHAERSVKEYKITTDLLRDLVDDLVKISEHLHYLDTFQGEMWMPLSERAEAQPILACAWRYKRP